MLLALVLKSTDEPIYTYDTETKKPKFADDSIARYMKENGITVTIPMTEGNMLQRKTATLDDPNFHELFFAYSKVEYPSPTFQWKFLKK